jgi:hypothetical protein
MHDEIDLAYIVDEAKAFFQGLRRRSAVVLGDICYFFVVPFLRRPRSAPHTIDPLCTQCPSKGKKLGNFQSRYGNLPDNDYVQSDIYEGILKSLELETGRALSW